jgi:hypothetical protein
MQWIGYTSIGYTSIGYSSIGYSSIGYSSIGYSSIGYSSIGYSSIGYSSIGYSSIGYSMCALRLVRLGNSSTYIQQPMSTATQIAYKNNEHYQPRQSVGRHYRLQLPALPHRLLICRD